MRLWGNVAQEVHHGLKCLLDYSGEESVEEVFGLTFEVRYRTVFGENKAHNAILRA